MITRRVIGERQLADLLDPQHYLLAREVRGTPIPEAERKRPSAWSRRRQV